MIPARAASRRSTSAVAAVACVAALCLLGAAPAPPPPPPPLTPLPSQPPGVSWPTRGWIAGPLPPKVDRAALEKALAVVERPQPKLGETRAVVIVQGGRLVAERYMPGYGPDTPLISWSVAKSFTQALTGIAVRQGLVDIDKPMGNPRWAPGDARAAITWRHWLNMVDGQQYREIGVLDPTRNDAARMLFGEGRLDVAGYAAGLPLAHPPGTVWSYNSAGINLVADALGRVFAPGAGPAERRARVREVMARGLFEPLGMSSAQPQFDAAGTFVGSAFLYATARDYARFGLLYLRDGVWDGRRILPEGWVDFARTRNPAANCDIYGAGWWIAPAEGQGRPDRALVRRPKDLFAAHGMDAQLIVVVPSKDLVIVRLGLLEGLGGWYACGDWVQGLIDLFPTLPPR